MISIEEQIKCIGRELGMRRAVYPRFIAAGKLTKEKADAELAAMDAVYATLKELKAKRDDEATDERR